MTETKTFHVDLPADLSRLVDGEIASGRYASESEVIGEGLRALRERDEAL